MDSVLGCSLRQQVWTAKTSCKIHKFYHKRLCRISRRIDLLLSSFRANMCTTERENTQNETEDSTMNEKVARQIEEMKKQTIGVEVEMYNITREMAVRTIAAFYHTENTVTYTGGTYKVWSCKDDKNRELPLGEEFLHLLN